MIETSTQKGGLFYGAGGGGDVTVEELDDYIKENWECIRDKIMRREYKPQPDIQAKRRS